MTRLFSRKGGWSEVYTKGYRSGLEEANQKYMAEAGYEVPYEAFEIPYEVPASDHKYTPDFVLLNGIIIETKGLLETSDRKKHLLIKKQYPHLDIRFVFSNPNTKLYKGSPTTYAKWCETNGFLYAKKFPPLSWFKEARKDTSGLVPKKGRNTP